MSSSAKPVDRLTYTVPEVAALLGLNRGTAYLRIADGTIASVRVGRRVLVPRVAIDRLLAAAAS